MERKEKITLLEKRYWSSRDISNYFDVSIRKARTMFKKAVLNNVKMCSYDKFLISSDGILQFYESTNRLDELKFLSDLEK